VFLSARFGDGGAEKEVAWMRNKLEGKGVTVYPSEHPGNLDRNADIANGVQSCDLFVFFGQAHYGEDTGNPMCSYREFNYANDIQKPMAWLNMNDGKRPGSPVVRMGLQGCIYEKWHQDDAIIAWVLDKVQKARCEIAGSHGGSDKPPGIQQQVSYTYTMLPEYQ